MRVLIALLLVMASFGPAVAQDREWIPQDLKAWQGWVLHGVETGDCPALMGDTARRECLFPTRLSLSVDASGAVFSQTWRVFAPQNVPLPSASGLWPVEVKLGGKDAAVLDVNGAPALRLGPGEYQVSGKLAWKQRPQSLAIPVQTGLIALTVDGKPVASPRLTPEGRLELAASSKEKAPEEALRVRVFRLLRDGLPFTVTTLARLEVSGRARTITLDGLLPEGTKPMGVISPVPVGFGPAGQVLVQTGAGRFDVEITSRAPGPVTAFGPATAPFGREIWSFAPDARLRDVRLAGMPPADPQTTDLPQAWREYPAFVAEAGTTLALAEIRRGESSKLPSEITARRELWLDFDGQGVTALDHLSGNIRKDWSLSMASPGELGRVSLSGKDQPVVLLGEGGLRGVELRQSALDLTAESRVMGRVLPASGWRADVSSLSVTLNLPPGWRLFSATGPDQVNDSWVSRWNLLNIFLTLFMALAAFKLCGIPAALALLAYLALAQHEPGAPVELWLPLLAALALRMLVERKGAAADWPRAARMVKFFHVACLFALAAVALPFVFDQIRQGLYPQLGWPTGPTQMAEAEFETAAAPAPPASVAPRGAGEARKSASVAKRAGVSAMSDAASPNMLEQDPKSLVQTGPGLPAWHWRSVRLSWNGPVDAKQSITLYLIGPKTSLALCLARVALLLAALGLMARPLAGGNRLFPSAPHGGMPKAGTDGGTPRAEMDGGTPTSGTGDGTPTAAPEGGMPRVGTVDGMPKPGKGARASEARAVVLGLAALAAVLLVAASATAAQYPPKELLDEFKTRLTAPEPCFPHCAGASDLSISLDGSGLRLTVGLGAATRAALPLPVVSDGWSAQSVVLDGKPAGELLSREGGLWILVGPGPHTVVLAGPAPSGVSFGVSWTLAPHVGRVSAPGWSVLGVGPDGGLEGGLRFARLEEAGKSGAPGQLAPVSAAIAPFLEVTRSLELGLNWEAETTVRRLTPLGEPVVAEVPLLAGESVLDQSVGVSGGKALVRLAAGQQEVRWRSRLEIAPALELAAPSGVPWMEVWQLRASPVWDVTLSGIPVVTSLNKAGQWQPQWRPWPGEKARAEIRRPAPAPGESLTIDSATLTLRPGARLEEATLSLALRSALGGRHVLTLPQRAEVQNLALNGKPVPWAGGKPGEVGVAIAPGRQNLAVAWREAVEAESGFILRAPAVELGSGAVNAQVTIDLPTDRWLLWVRGDTPMGPVVLFWGTLLGVAVAAFGLGFVPWSPLSRRQWFLLGLGLTQAGPEGALLAVAWLLALGVRRNFSDRLGAFWFDAMQVGLVVLVLMGLSALFEAIRTGLLGLPVMQVGGNGSTAYHLVWTYDRVAGLMPRPEVLSVSLWWYRGVMLAWSLWMAFSLLRWLRWGWECFSVGGVWRKPEMRLPKLPIRPKPTAAGQAQPPQDGALRPGLEDETGK